MTAIVMGQLEAVNWPVPSGDDHSTRLSSLAALGGYLRGSGWALVDEDSRTSMWRPENAPADDLFVVLPAREDFKDYGERVHEALRAVAYVERGSVSRPGRRLLLACPGE
jgi:hypothetical protein